MNDQSQLLLTSETAEQDFKAEFNPDLTGDWCELIKDIVAMANSGGGRILIGVNDDGTPSHFDVTKILGLDLAPVVDRIYKYTDVHFAGMTIRPERFGTTTIAVFEVKAAASPLAFNQAGNYAFPSGKQKIAFQQGTIYFRHGPKSEPATSDDLRQFIQRKNDEARSEILANLQKVVAAPPGAAISITVPTEDRAQVSATGQPVRLVDDPNAPISQFLDPNLTHPNRLKEVVQNVNSRVGERNRISVHDILGIRRLYKTDQKRCYFYKPKTGSGQYSDAFVDWVVGKITSEATFLGDLRQRHHDWVLEQNSNARVAPQASRFQWSPENRL